MTSAIATRPRAVWDVVLSVIFMVFALVAAVIGLFAQLFFLAFTDDCPPSTCHINQGVAGVFVTWTVVAVLLIASIVATIVLLRRRRRAWWVALCGLVVVIAGIIVGVTVYVAAVGYGG